MIEYTPIFVTGIVFFAVVYVIKIVSDNRIRSRLIDSGKIDEQIQYLYASPHSKERDPLSSLKWGLVLIGLGAALFIGRLFSYEMQEEATVGFMFLFSGLAFLIYYFASKNEQKKNPSEAENEM